MVSHERNNYIPAFVATVVDVQYGDGVFGTRKVTQINQQNVKSN